MSLAVTSMPDDPAQLAGWLDEQLVGARLADLVTELASINGTHTPADSVRDALGPSLAGVLENGLAALPFEGIRQLLRQPFHLFELQEFVFTEGGSYWTSVVRHPELRRRALRQWESLASEVLPSPAKPARGRRWYAAPWAVSLATAAAVLIAVGALTRFLPSLFGPPAGSVGWGWARADGLPKNTDAKGYLLGLADGGDEWFAKRPDTPVALARRLSELRQGCSVLLLAEHRPLTPAQRAWLKDRCRKWAGRLDEALRQLDAGQDVETARTGADSIVRDLVNVIRLEAARL